LDKNMEGELKMLKVFKNKKIKNEIDIGRNFS
jgi:hypothetical protein